jgi:hypothetical protein
MKPDDPHEPGSTPSPTGSPLNDLVEDKLNNSLADEIAAKLDERDEESRTGTSDYASGTAEHDDEPDA